MTTPLAPEKLLAACAPEDIPYDGSDALPDDGQALSGTQPRALSALTLALSLKSREYNVFLAGEPYLGRTRFVRSILDPAAAARPAPPDILYVHNFDDPDRPRALTMPAGQGRAFKTELAKAVGDIRDEIPARFERESYHMARQGLMRGFTSDRESLFGEMEERAKEEGFNLVMDDGGALNLYPLIEGKVVSDEEFERLDPDLKKELRARGDTLLDELGAFLRRIGKEERGLRDKEKSLDRETVAEVLDWRLADLFAAHADNAEVAAYLAAVKKDILDNVEALIPRDAPPAAQAGPGQFPESAPADDVFSRHEANLFVDNGAATGAPVVVEDHPTYFNLMGCIERESEMGALFTDYTLIKAGSLHKANGGFLILRVDELSQHPGAWESLLRALRSGQARIEDPAEAAEHSRTRTIEPEPVALNLTVILIGSDELYEYLLYSDERFAKLFKLKAHLQDVMGRTPENVDLFLRLIGRIIREAGLPRFSRRALAFLVEHASLLAEDQTKLSLKLSLCRDIMLEAAAGARAGGRGEVEAEDLEQARRAKDFRANLFEEEYLAEYDREIIKVSTAGQAVGRANGLSVRMFGDYAFGLPHQIACTVGVGHGGILDLEREAELGGPIHTKGMMILKSYLLGRFAHDKPLVLTGSLCFEQSYAEIEGDSASAAELAALLSALAERPIRLCYAFTGAVSQSGAILAVGGVNEKIRGFFAVCRRRGLTGNQGVLIPRDNVSSLMLDGDIIAAVAEGRFFVHPVARIEEAMELLTGLPAGAPGPDGRFPPDTLFGLVDERLNRMAAMAHRFERGGFTA